MRGLPVEGFLTLDNSIWQAKLSSDESKMICAFCFETKAHQHAVFGRLVVNEVSCSVKLKSNVPDFTFNEDSSKEEEISVDSCRSIKNKDDTEDFVFLETNSNVLEKGQFSEHTIGVISKESGDTSEKFASFLCGQSVSLIPVDSFTDSESQTGKIDISLVLESCMSVGENLININEETEAISSTDEEKEENEHNRDFVSKSDGNVKPYICKICCKTFCWKNDLERHNSVFHNMQELSYICDICTRGFRYPDRLRNHRASVHGLDVKRVSCKLCNHESVTRDHHWCHMKAKHWSILKKICMEDITFQAMFETDANADKNHPSSNEKSDEISKYRVEMSENTSFSNRRTESTVAGNFTIISNMNVSPSYQDHEMCTSIDKDSQLVCNINEKRNEKLSGQCSNFFYPHQKVQSSIENNKTNTHACEVGCKTFDQKRDLEMPNSDCHNTPVELPYLCEICGKSLYYPKRLRDHQGSVHGIDVRPVICGISNHKSLTQDRHRYHMKVKHSGNDISRKESTKDAFFLEVSEGENACSTDEETGDDLKLQDETNAVNYFDLTNALDMSPLSQDQESFNTLCEEPQLIDRNGKHEENSPHNSPGSIHDHIKEGSLLMNTKSKANTCEICSEVFKCKRDFEKHNTECHNKPFDLPCVCNICGKNLYYPKRLRNHRVSVHGIDMKPIICEICNHESVTQDHHNYHIKSRHGGKNIIIKKNSTENFESWRMSEENGDRNHQFANENSCGISKLSEDKCKVNVCLSNGKTDLSFREFRKTTKCNAGKITAFSSFEDEDASKSLAGEPVVSDIGENQEKNPFNYSSKTRHTLQNRELPLKTTNIKANTCEICCKTFGRKYNFEKHISECHNIQAKMPYVCEICGKNLYYPKRLINHLTSTHGVDVKPVTCEICNHESATQGQLSYHMKLKHSSRNIITINTLEEISDDLIESNMCLSNRKSNPLFEEKSPIKISDNKFAVVPLSDYRGSSTTATEDPLLVSDIDERQAKNEFSSKISSNYQKAELPTKTTKMKANTCEICCKTFHRKYNFDKHNSECHNIQVELPYVCEICGKNLYYPKRLINHLASAHGVDIKPVICEICKHKSATQDHHEYHMKVKHGGWSLRNKDGGKHLEVFQAPEKNANHHSTHPKSDEVSKVPEDINKINEEFSRKQSNSCFDTTTESTTFKNFSTTSRMEVSPFSQNEDISTISIHEEDKLVKTTIEKQKEVAFGSRLRAVNDPRKVGMTNNAAKKTNAKTCKICSKTFSRKRSLENHNSLCHKLYYLPHVCEICGKGFRYPIKLRNHRSCVHGIDVKPVNCKICNHKSLTQDHHRYHMKAKHEGRIFMCEHCGKSFNVLTSLNRHLKGFCTAIFPKVICDICGASLSAPGFLSSHMKLHDTCFKCNKCDLVFSSYGKLRIHKLSHRFAKNFERDEETSQKSD